MNNIFSKKNINEYIYIISGALFIALGVVLFFIPNHFTTGGTPGIGILLHHLSGLSIGLIVVLVNIPLLIWGYRYLGFAFALKTIFTIALISSFIDILSFALKNIHLVHDILLASVFGGAVIGLGVGLIIKGNSSAGGATIVARILNAQYQIKAANVILISDVIIVLSSIYVFKDFEKALWSIMSIYVTAKLIDIVLTGTLSTKVIHIVSSKPELLSKKISDTLGVEGSIIRGSNFQKQSDKTILLLVLNVKKLSLLKEIIEENDKEGFMIVMEASEMLGRGH